MIFYIKEKIMAVMLESLKSGDRFYFADYPNYWYSVIRLEQDSPFICDVIVKYERDGREHRVSGYREVIKDEKIDAATIAKLNAFEKDLIPKKKEKEKSMTKVVWKNAPAKVLKFEDLQLNDSFRINTKKAKGAVYTKVRHYDEFFMLEVATGKLFDATKSVVVPVEVEVVVGTDKPSIY